jgi:hypothetical protein
MLYLASTWISGAELPMRVTDELVSVAGRARTAVRKSRVSSAVRFIYHFSEKFYEK